MIEHVITTTLGMWLQAPPPNSGDKLGEQIGQEVAKSLEQAQVGQQVADAMKHVPWHQVTVIGALTGVLVPLGFFTLIGLIILMQVRKSQARTRTQLELQKQLLDKFTSGREFGEFLESKGGQKFLENALSPATPRFGSSVSSIRTGTLLGVFGLGLLLLSSVRHGFLVAGTVFLALGAGFLISGFVSHRLSEKWAVKPDKPSGPTSEPVSQN
jgi:hypothetical protein